MLLLSQSVRDIPGFGQPGWDFGRLSRFGVLRPLFIGVVKTRWWVVDFTWPPPDFNHLSDSMPRRIEAVLAVKVRMTNY